MKLEGPFRLLVESLEQDLQFLGLGIPPDWMTLMGSGNHALAAEVRGQTAHLQRLLRVL